MDVLLMSVRLDINIVICSFKFRDAFVVRHADQLITECCSHPR